MFVIKMFEFTEIFMDFQFSCRDYNIINIDF